MLVDVRFPGPQKMHDKKLRTVQRIVEEEEWGAHKPNDSRKQNSSCRAPHEQFRAKIIQSACTDDENPVQRKSNTNKDEG